MESNYKRAIVKGRPMPRCQVNHQCSWLQNQKYFCSLVDSDTDPFVLLLPPAPLTKETGKSHIHLCLRLTGSLKLVPAADLEAANDLTPALSVMVQESFCPSRDLAKHIFICASRSNFTLV